MRRVTALSHLSNELVSFNPIKINHITECSITSAQPGTKVILKIDWFTLSLLNLYFSAWHELNKRSLWSIFKSVTVTETSSKLFIIRHKKVGVRGRIREAIKIEWGQDSQDHMSLKTLKNLLFKEKIHLVNTWSTDWPESNLNWHTFLTKTDLTGHTN